MMARQTYSEPRPVRTYDAAAPYVVAWNYYTRTVTVDIMITSGGEQVETRRVGEYSMDALPEPWATMRDSQANEALDLAIAGGAIPEGGTRE